MRIKPVEDIKDEAIKEHFDFVQQEAQGKVLELSAAPTAGTPLLESNEWGTYNNVLYHRVGNDILVFTPGSVITIT